MKKSDEGSRVQVINKCRVVLTLRLICVQFHQNDIEASATLILCVHSISAKTKGTGNVAEFEFGMDYD